MITGLLLASKNSTCTTDTSSSGSVPRVRITGPCKYLSSVIVGATPSVQTLGLPVQDWPTSQRSSMFAGSQASPSATLLCGTTSTSTSSVAWSRPSIKRTLALANLLTLASEVAVAVAVKSMPFTGTSNAMRPSAELAEPSQAASNTNTCALLASSNTTAMLYTPASGWVPVTVNRTASPFRPTTCA